MFKLNLFWKIFNSLLFKNTDLYVVFEVKRQWISKEIQKNQIDACFVCESVVSVRFIIGFFFSNLDRRSHLMVINILVSHKDPLKMYSPHRSVAVWRALGSAASTVFRPGLHWLLISPIHRSSQNVRIANDWEALAPSVSCQPGNVLGRILLCWVGRIILSKQDDHQSYESHGSSLTVCCLL